MGQNMSRRVKKKKDEDIELFLLSLVSVSKISFVEEFSEIIFGNKTVVLISYLVLSLNRFQNLKILLAVF